MAHRGDDLAVALTTCSVCVRECVQPRLGAARHADRTQTRFRRSQDYTLPHTPLLIQTRTATHLCQQLVAREVPAGAVAARLRAEGSEGKDHAVVSASAFLLWESSDYDQHQVSPGRWRRRTPSPPRQRARCSRAPGPWRGLCVVFASVRLLAERMWRCDAASSIELPMLANAHCPNHCVLSSRSSSTPGVK